MKIKHSGLEGTCVVPLDGIVFTFLNFLEIHCWKFLLQDPPLGKKVCPKAENLLKSKVSMI